MHVGCGTVGMAHSIHVPGGEHGQLCTLMKLPAQANWNHLTADMSSQMTKVT